MRERRGSSPDFVPGEQGFGRMAADFTDFFAASGWQDTDDEHPPGDGMPAYRVVYKTVKTHLPEVNMVWPNLVMRFGHGSVRRGGMKLGEALPLRRDGHWLLPQPGETVIEGHDDDLQALACHELRVPRLAGGGRGAVLRGASAAHHRGAPRQAPGRGPQQAHLAQGVIELPSDLACSARSSPRASARSSPTATSIAASNPTAWATSTRWASRRSRPMSSAPGRGRCWQTT
jgi:hypothetical protein